MDQPFAHLPLLPISQESLFVMERSISGYLPYLQRSCPVPAHKIERLQAIRQQLAPLLQPGDFPEGTALPLTWDDLQAVDEAICGFMVLLRHLVSPTPDRELTLGALGQFHKQIHAFLVRGTN
jgi:hypothetical protein